MWMSSTCHTTFSPVNFEKLNTDQCIKELKAVCFNSFPFILCSCTHAIFAVWVSIKQYYCGWAGCEEVECAWGTDRLHQSHSSGQKYPLKCYNLFCWDLHSYYMVIFIWNMWKSVSAVFQTQRNGCTSNFEMFGNQMQHSFECLI